MELYPRSQVANLDLRGEDFDIQKNTNFGLMAELSPHREGFILTLSIMRFGKGIRCWPEWSVHFAKRFPFSKMPEATCNIRQLLRWRGMAGGLEHGDAILEIFAASAIAAASTLTIELRKNNFHITLTAGRYTTGVIIVPVDTLKPFLKRL